MTLFAGQLGRTKRGLVCRCMLCLGATPQAASWEKEKRPGETYLQNVQKNSSCNREYPRRRYIKRFALLYGTKSNNIPEARWKLFKKCSYELERLSPTAGSLKQAILRAHCQARTWCVSDKPNQLLPNPVNCGWEISEGVFETKTSETPIAPDSVLHLMKGGCGSNCLSNRFKCCKNKLVCTDLCECGDTYDNTDVGRFVNDEVFKEDEMLTEMLL